MARSKRKTPAMGNTLAQSDKQGKQLGSRQARRANTVELQVAGEDYEPVDRRAVDNVYSHDKDGKQYCSAETIAKQPELMRK